MSADEILDALDPDQRAVAQALRGPVCVLAGRGHRQDAGHHPPHRLRRADRRLHPDDGPRRHVHRPRRGRDAHPSAGPRRRGRAGPHLPRRGAAPAELLLAQGRRRRPAADPRAQGPRGRRRRRAGCRCRWTGSRSATSRGEVEWAKVSLVTADDYVRATAAVDRPAPAGFDRQTVARLISVYEDVKTERGVIDFEDVLLMLADMLNTPPGRRRDGPGAVPVLRGRRVPGRLAAAAVPARPVARRARRAVRGR